MPPALPRQTTRRNTLVDLVLIEPGVYWRVFSLDYQAEQFEVFHRSALTRWTHDVGTHLILGALLLLTMGRHLGPIPLGLLVWVLHAVQAHVPASEASRSEAARCPMTPTCSFGGASPW